MCSRRWHLAQSHTTYSTQHLASRIMTAKEPHQFFTELWDWDRDAKLLTESNVTINGDETHVRRLEWCVIGRWQHACCGGCHRAPGRCNCPRLIEVDVIQHRGNGRILDRIDVIPRDPAYVVQMFKRRRWLITPHSLQHCQLRNVAHYREIDHN